MKEYFKKNSSIVISIAIAVFYAIGNFIWWKLNTPIIPKGICAAHFLDIFDGNFFYNNAPLITWIMKGTFAIFGVTNFDLQIICVNYIFFLIALCFIYKLGVELKDKEMGIIAMILFSLTPAIYGLSRQYGHQEYQVMVAIIINIYCLIKCNDFKDRKWSILYGISVGIGLLVKDEFLAYFFTPWLYVVIRGLINKIEKQKIQKVSNIIITIFLGSLISGSHYFRSYIVSKILKDPFVEVFVDPFSFDSIRITTIGLSEYLLSPPICLIFLVGLIWFIIKNNNKNKIIILLWMIIPWIIVFCMPHHKLSEYYVGLVPAMILISSSFISSLKKIKKILLVILMFVLSLQYVDFSHYTDTKLFNYCMRYKHYIIHYYDKYFNNRLDQNIVAYKKNNLLISLSYYLKNNFENKSLFFYKLSLISIDPEELISFLNVNNFGKSLYLYFEDSLKSDIIIHVEKIDAKYIFEIEKEALEQHYELANMDELKENIVSLMKQIENEYIQIDDFYLDESNKTKENHIIILGKKEQFKDKQIKYPYKFVDKTI